MEALFKPFASDVAPAAELAAVITVAVIRTGPTCSLEKDVEIFGLKQETGDER